MSKVQSKKIVEVEEDETDNESFVQTSNAALGFVDVEISEKEQPDIEDSIIGGQPIWLDDRSPPPEEMLMCKNCNSPLHLFLQTYANLENKLYDRVLYVFGCPKPSCRRKPGSFRAIRAIGKDPVKIKEWEDALKREEEEKLNRKLKLEEKKKYTIEVTKDLFSNLGSKDSKKTENAFTSSSNPFDSNPFGNNDSNKATKESNPFDSNPFSATQDKKETTAALVKNEEEKPKKSMADVLNESTIKEKESKPKKKLSIKLPEFPGYILYVDTEVLDKSHLPDFALPDDVEISNNDSAPPSTKPLPKVSEGSAEKEEISRMLDDPTFQHFTEILAYNPGQVMRYELNGTPLLYSAKDNVSKIFYDEKGRLRDQPLIPNPGYNPSSSRRFELQLMPKMIIDLEEGNEDIINGMEWGTVIVATDESDFIPKLDENHIGYVEEWCGVQWEEEVKRGI
ncbi:hypothetical protein B5S28_g2546 [[Candida] boidinii]|nr:hypothetical protein B5S28_g2546 [[Candida] boidinii]OWB63516.1 hypothetical protein B5S29_g4500 [[Candida] boidinii]OWB78702.1 hypothetical protein B5S32_g2902 [[Candida] boidinii]